MLKAVGSNSLGVQNAVFLGISRNNWDKLLAGQPIMVKLRDLSPELPDIAVTLLGGETEDDLTEDLRALAPIRRHEDRRRPGDEGTTP